MKKYLLLTGLLAVLTYNSAAAQGYYYEDDGYYYEQPKPTYQEPKYEKVIVEDYKPMQPVQKVQPQYEKRAYIIKKGKPQYHHITTSEAKQYEDNKIIKTKEVQTNKFRPYIGIDVSAIRMKFGNADGFMKDEDGKYFKSGIEAISAHIGTRIDKYFGIEGYYQQSGKASKTAEHELLPGGYFDSKDSLSYKSYGVDFIGYVPITQEFELLAALGIGQYDFDTEVKLLKFLPGYIIESKDFDSIGVRLGIGAQYNITDHFALRGMVRHIKMMDSDYVKNLMEISLGIRYMF